MAWPVPRLHVVTDDAVLASSSFREGARAVLTAGGASVALHLRGAGTAGRRLHALAESLVAEAESAGALLVVNDRVDVALVARAHGVQLGGRSLPADRVRDLLPGDPLVGVSTHTPEEVAAAERDEADWAFVGTIFTTPSHPGRPGAGLGLLRRAAEARASLPLVAIGGMTPARVPDARAAGAWGVAVLRGVWDAPDPAAAVEHYLHQLEQET